MSCFFLFCFILISTMNNSEVIWAAHPFNPEPKALTFALSLQSARLSTDSDSTNNNMEVIFLGQSTNSTYNNNSGYTHDNSVDSGLSSCKTLQRKLELKVERARRSFSHNQQEIRTVTAAIHLSKSFSLLDREWLFPNRKRKPRS